MAAVIQRIQAALLVAVECLVAGHPRYPELAAGQHHLLAFQRAGHESQSFVHRSTRSPGRRGNLPCAPPRRCIRVPAGSSPVRGIEAQIRRAVVRQWRSVRLGVGVLQRTLQYGGWPPQWPGITQRLRELDCS